MLRLEKYSEFLEFFPDIESLAIDDSPEYLLLWSQYLLQKASIPALTELFGHLVTKSNDFWPLKLVLVALNLHLNNVDEASSLLSTLERDAAGCLEALRLTSRIYEKTSNWSSALNILQSIWSRFPEHKPSRIQLLDVAVRLNHKNILFQFLIPIFLIWFNKRGSYFSQSDTSTSKSFW